MPHRELHVFVVDDVQIVAPTLAMILGRSGFDLTFFSDPQEAIRAARLEAPDLLIFDVVMPFTRGHEGWPGGFRISRSS